MYYLLQKEVEISGNNLFTSTVFITWERVNNSLLIFWGNELSNKYCEATIDGQSASLSVYINEFTEALNEKSFDDKNKLITNIIQQCTKNNLKQTIF
jgi:hypothetical protein